MRLYLIILFTCNITACIFYYIGLETYDTYGTNWMDTIEYTEATDSLGTIYLFSLYWSIATMSTVGYGDVTARNPVEVFYACVVMFVATVSFGYAINQVIEVL